MCKIKATATNLLKIYFMPNEDYSEPNRHTHTHTHTHTLNHKTLKARETDRRKEKDEY